MLPVEYNGVSGTELVFGYDIILELLFGAITLVLGLTALKVYRLSGQRETKLFSAAFILISISYFVWALLNIIGFFRLSGAVCEALAIDDAKTLAAIGLMLHMLLYLAGIVTWTFMTFRTENNRVLTLLIVLTSAWLVLAYEKFWVFHVLIAILFVYLMIHYFSLFLKKPGRKTFLMLLAVFLLFLGSANFIFSIGYPVYYAVGHLFELSAYALILAELYFVMRK
ncbi:MAG: hypothetical protein HC945_01715 [Nitrosarchaeum sp.]|nr:hypothetical protein [Nitrosarchaeum sp.]